MRQFMRLAEKAVKDENPARMLKRMLMAVAMTVVVISNAWALEPKENVTITAENVTVGDVFPAASSHTGHVLAPAPDFGKTLVLSAADLKRISDAFNLGWAPVSATQKSVIRRSAREVRFTAVEEALHVALAAKLKDHDFELVMQERDFSFYVPEGEDDKIAVRDLEYNYLRHDFRGTVTVGSARRAVQGRVYTLVEVPVLKNTLTQKDTIVADDIEYRTLRAADIGSTVVTDMEKLLGMSPRRVLAAGKPVAAGDVTLPLVVRKGDLVTMVLQNRALHLTTQGRALESGAAGAAVRVVNTSSNQVIDAIVTGPQTVAVQPPGLAPSM